MAIAIFNSVRGKSKKTALILVKPNLLVTNADPAYVPVAGVEHFANKEIGELNKGDSFEIPDGYKLVNVFDIETGEQIYTGKDGDTDRAPIKQLAY